jgi:hypothetical protein
MIGAEPCCALEAFIETDQLDWTGDLAPSQLVTVMMTDGMMGSRPRSARSPSPRRAASRSSCSPWPSTHAEWLTRVRENER